MIDLKQIESFYPKAIKPFKTNLLREYFQYKILEIIYDSKWSNSLVFMGGTSLRIIHSLNRFSEDLDFDNLKLTQKDFKELSQSIKKKLNLQGYTVDIKNIFKDTFHAHIRIADMLHKTGVSGHKQAKIMIRIDTQEQRFAYKPDQVLMNKFDVFLKINVVPIDILLAQKITAIFNRKRAMGRDFYDVIFLFGRTKPNMDYLKTKLKIQTPEQLKQKLLLRCEKLNFKQLAKDVERFLINPLDVKRVTHFKEYIETYKF